jgi:DNA-binding response OmpR family regulator
LQVIANSPPLCPCCGNEVGDKPDPKTIIATTRLGRVARLALLFLSSRMGRWASVHDICNSVYAEDPNGGPDGAANSITVTMWRIRPQLRGTGIVLDVERGAGYRLRWETA